MIAGVVLIEEYRRPLGGHATLCPPYAISGLLRGCLPRRLQPMKPAAQAISRSPAPERARDGCARNVEEIGVTPSAPDHLDHLG